MRISDWSSDVCSSDLCVRIFEESSRTASERLKDIMEQLMRAYSDNFPNMYVYIQEDMEKIASEKSVWAHEIMGQTRLFEQIVNKLNAAALENGKLRSEISVLMADKAVFRIVKRTQ